jgi:rhodanese-related sulfurtransferase
MTAKCTISHAITKFPNVSHINLPLNDEDLLESLHSKTNHLPSNSQFITMCAKGYRSTIGYSLINLLKQGSWDVRLCRNSANEIIKELNKVEKIEKIAYEEQHALSFS